MFNNNPENQSLGFLNNFKIVLAVISIIIKNKSILNNGIRHTNIVKI
jgi:hypothetical protein